MIELNYEHAKIVRRTERRVWIILFIFAVFFGGLLLFSMYGCSRSEVSPGQTWIYILEEDNPFKIEEIKYENEVLEVKDDWIKYQSNKYKDGKLIRSTIENDRISWFLIDSKLKEKPCIK